MVQVLDFLKNGGLCCQVVQHTNGGQLFDESTQNKSCLAFMRGPFVVKELSQPQEPRSSFH